VTPYVTCTSRGWSTLISACNQNGVQPAGKGSLAVCLASVCWLTCSGNFERFMVTSSPNCEETLFAVTTEAQWFVTCSSYGWAPIFSVQCS
jgi:hypothetical protein